MRRPLVLLAVVAIVVAAVRRHLVVRAIRAVDRRGGLATRHGERAYAGAAGLFAGLHARAASDAIATLDGRGTVIDVGAGPGDVLAAIRTASPGVEALGIEPSAEMRSIAAARGITELDGSAEALPIADASVDLIVSTLSAHHWHDPVAAIREMARVLRPGGEARIYDVRFAAFSTGEARSMVMAAGLDPSSVTRRVLAERLFGVRPYCSITITPSVGSARATAGDRTPARHRSGDLEARPVVSRRAASRPG